MYQLGSPCHHRLRARRLKHKAVHSLISEGGAPSLVSVVQAAPAQGLRSKADASGRVGAATTQG